MKFNYFKKVIYFKIKTKLIMINLYSLIIFMEINKKIFKDIFIVKKYYKDIKFEDEILPLINKFD